MVTAEGHEVSLPGRLKSFESPRHKVSLRLRSAPLKPKCGLNGPPDPISRSRKRLSSRLNRTIPARGLAHPLSLILTLEGAPSLSRFLRQGGEFDLPRTGWSRSRNPRPVPAKSAGTRTGHPLEQLATTGAGQPPARRPQIFLSLFQVMKRNAS